MSLPKVSVGICAYTEEGSTLRLVDSMLNVDDGRFSIDEVIVATPNERLASQLRDRDGRVRVIFEPRREGKAAALNKVLKLATGDIFLHASADIRLPPGTVSALLGGLMAELDCGAVVSHVRIINDGPGLMDRISVLIWSLFNNLNATLNEERKLGQAGDLYAFRRELALRVPASIINDDAYIALRIRDQGYHIKKIPDAQVWIGGPKTPTDYLSQRSRILEGHLQIVGEQKHVPTTFEFTLLSAPRRNIGVLARTIAQLGADHLPALIVSFALEFLSFGIALSSKLRGRRSNIWPVVPTTKEG